MKIDLGQKEEFVVSFAGADYVLSAPTVRQAQALQDQLKDKEGKEVDVFVDLLDEIGMPREVTETLSTKQLLKLSEGILGNAQAG